jgi:hypothetical protein
MSTKYQRLYIKAQLDIITQKKYVPFKMPNILKDLEAPTKAPTLEEINSKNFKKTSCINLLNTLETNYKLTPPYILSLQIPHYDCYWKTGIYRIYPVFSGFFRFSDSDNIVTPNKTKTLDTILIVDDTTTQEENHLFLAQYLFNGRKESIPDEYIIIFKTIKKTSKRGYDAIDHCEQYIKFWSYYRLYKYYSRIRDLKGFVFQLASSSDYLLRELKDDINKNQLRIEDAKSKQIQAKKRYDEHIKTLAEEELNTHLTTLERYYHNALACIPQEYNTPEVTNIINELLTNNDHILKLLTYYALSEESLSIILEKQKVQKNLCKSLQEKGLDITSIILKNNLTESIDEKSQLSVLSLQRYIDKTLELLTKNQLKSSPNEATIASKDTQLKLKKDCVEQFNFLTFHGLYRLTMELRDINSIKNIELDDYISLTEYTPNISYIDTNINLQKIKNIIKKNITFINIPEILINIILEYIIPGAHTAHYIENNIQQFIDIKEQIEKSITPEHPQWSIILEANNFYDNRGVKTKKDFDILLEQMKALLPTEKQIFVCI